MRKLILITFALASSITNTLHAQSVSLDSSFGNAGIVITPTPNSSEIISIAIQPDGKIVAAGYSNNLGGYHFQTARYNSDGTIDNNFGASGIVNTVIDNSDMPYCIALQMDGKIIVAGNIRANTSPPFKYHCAMVRYNMDGSLDNNFGIGGIVTTIVDSSEDGIASVSLQPDGKIVAGGYAGNQFLLIRYKDDGTLDDNFGMGGIVLTSIEWEASIYSIVLQNDGKIIATGTTGDITNFKFALARYNTDGTLDTGFSTVGTVITDIDSFFYDFATSIALLSDGKIVIAGYSGDNIALAKYNTNGILDSNFGKGGKVSMNNFPPVSQNSLAIQSDGKIIVCGNTNITPSNSYGFSLTRFNTDGTPDSSFGVNGNITTDIKTGHDYAQCLSLQSDGKIVIGGSSRDSSTSPANFTLVRFNSDLNTKIREYSFHDNDLLIYPNPFNEKITLQIINWDKLRNTNLHFEMHDVLGRKVKQLPITAPLSEIKRDNLPCGIYFYKILSDKKETTNGKLIIQ